jgi:hypothetical protein
VRVVERRGREGKAPIIIIIILIIILIIITRFGSYLACLLACLGLVGCLGDELTGACLINELGERRRGD